MVILEQPAQALAADDLAIDSADAGLGPDELVVQPTNASCVDKGKEGYDQLVIDLTSGSGDNSITESPKHPPNLSRAFSNGSDRYDTPNGSCRCSIGDIIWVRSQVGRPETRRCDREFDQDEAGVHSAR